MAPQPCILSRSKREPCFWEAGALQKVLKQIAPLFTCTYTLLSACSTSLEFGGASSKALKILSPLGMSTLMARVCCKKLSGPNFQISRFTCFPMFRILQLKNCYPKASTLNSSTPGTQPCPISPSWAAHQPRNKTAQLFSHKLLSKDHVLNLQDLNPKSTKNSSPTP